MILLAHQKPVPKILCDHSLEDAAHWLRAAGYDVHIPITQLSDIELLNLAIKDNRVLIINNNHVQDLPDNFPSVISLKSSLIYEQIKQLGDYLSIDWLYRPLSRCMICNSRLTPLNINQWIELPVSIQEKTVTSHGCPQCQRIYWAGEQIDRMIHQLESFKSLKNE